MNSFSKEIKDILAKYQGKLCSEAEAALARLSKIQEKHESEHNLESFYAMLEGAGFFVAIIGKGMNISWDGSPVELKVDTRQIEENFDKHFTQTTLDWHDAAQALIEDMEFSASKLKRFQALLDEWEQLVGKGRCQHEFETLSSGRDGTTRSCKLCGMMTCG